MADREFLERMAKEVGLKKFKRTSDDDLIKRILYQVEVNSKTTSEYSEEFVGWYQDLPNEYFDDENEKLEIWPDEDKPEEIAPLGEEELQCRYGIFKNNEKACNAFFNAWAERAKKNDISGMTIVNIYEEWKRGTVSLLIYRSDYDRIMKEFC